MGNKLTLYIFCFTLVTLSVSKLSGQITILEDPAITDLMDFYKAENAKTEIVRAWRIQILTTNDRLEMEQGIRKFEMLYPHKDYDWQHNPPYYQVRTGAFEIRDDLEAYLLELKKDFHAAIPVQAEMRKEDLLDK